MQEIFIRNLGPIQNCKMKIDDFTILTGPQSSGKSTIARAIYFFRTMKNDIFISSKVSPAPPGKKKRDSRHPAPIILRVPNCKNPFI